MNPWGVPPPTEAEFFNAVRPTAFLLVEGGSDARFWEARVDRRRCKVRAMGGRDLALEELRKVRVEKRDGFVAILDADFDRADGTLVEAPDVVWTDLHDLELLLVASPALEKVLAATVSREKRERFEAAEERSVRDAVVDRALDLGRLRWLSRREALGITFRKKGHDGELRYLDYGAFCDRAWNVDRTKLVQAVLDFSSRHELSAQDLLARADRLPAVDTWQLCVGHDVVGLLMVGLRSKLGSRRLSMEEIQERLRLAFERAHLEETAMYRELRGWERRNAPYRIFSLP